MENTKNQNLKITKERRIKNKDTKGELDEDGFFRTPNGSFWDCDGEYFNRNGYDIHGGSYSNILDYVPGPTWIDELGCYPEEKEKYMKDDFDNDFEEGDADLDLKEGEEDICVEDYKKLFLLFLFFIYLLEKLLLKIYLLIKIFDLNIKHI